MMSKVLKLLLGGSPCTHWSIAQTKNREVEPSGLGWELFKNYKIARDKYQPDYFLYENNKSMSAAIREQITKELGVEPVLINSALVSAQSRQRLYWVGKREPDGTYSRVDVEQPEDKGILLRDILESGVCWREKSYTLKANYRKTSDANFIDGGHFPAPGAAEPVNITEDGKAQCLRASCYKDGIRNMIGNTVDRRTCAAEPVCLRVPEATKQGHTDILPGDCVDLTMPKSKTRRGQNMRDKSNCLTASHEYFQYCGTLNQSIYPTEANFELIAGCEIKTAAGKIRQCDCMGSKQGKYVYTTLAEKANSITAGQAHNEKVLVPAEAGKWKTIYKVSDGRITIKGKQYPIKLLDGYYIIRKLTVAECKRLQTVPEDYIFPVSDTQAYKMLGNGWTVDVIVHILSHIPGIMAEPVEVLSMYDGMSCGHIALDKLGASVTAYYATEIDKYAIQTTQANYPETVQLGDAFQVREDGWLERLLAV